MIKKQQNLIVCLYKAWCQNQLGKYCYSIPVFENFLDREKGFGCRYADYLYDKSKINVNEEEN